MLSMRILMQNICDATLCVSRLGNILTYVFIMIELVNIPLFRFIIEARRATNKIQPSLLSNPGHITKRVSRIYIFQLTNQIKYSSSHDHPLIFFSSSDCEL